MNKKTKIESGHKVEISNFLNANNYKWFSIDEVKNQINRNVKLEKLSNFSISKILKVDLIWLTNKLSRSNWKIFNSNKQHEWWEVQAIINKFYNDSYEIIYIDEFKYSAYNEKQYGWIKKNSNFVYFKPADNIFNSFWVWFSELNIHRIMWITTTFDSKLFIEFIEQMMEFILQKSIFVAENVAIHKTTEVDKYFEENKLLIIIIPPYSLWMNPIKNLILK